ncbi:hypothetical protein F5Y15DRAFT_14843 [Xylariaceae sp. FL0016]|nr:hypothetical protein F5Y15DRAFT_14843 [Xylariaceae sp. FL0016]
MTTVEVSPDSTTMSLTSYDTALCLIPPSHVWPSIDRLRSLYDKAYEKWPPHVNLIYPFVPIDDLSQATDLICSGLQSHRRELEERSFNIQLEDADVFPHRHDNTIFIFDKDSSRTSELNDLRRHILEALKVTITDHHSHMTIGQSEDIHASSHHYLLKKARLLPNIEWNVDKLQILRRERMLIDGTTFTQMKLWGTIDLANLSLSKPAVPVAFYDGKKVAWDNRTINEINEDNEELNRTPLTFSSSEDKWIPYTDFSKQIDNIVNPKSFGVASYNVLADFEYPPVNFRYPILVQNLLDQLDSTDIVVLEEVTDDFLTYLCRNDRIRRQFTYITHGPPDQADLEPLASHLNVVVLSKWAFTWNRVTFQRRHKGSLILKLHGIGKRDGEDLLPIILSTAHLTCGLSDGAVAAKKLELQSIINHLSTYFPRNPWILGGDFNITTSTYTIKAALEKRAISSQTAKYLKSMETMLTETGFVDAWNFSRLHYGDISDDHDQLHLDEAFEGEQGATFDPGLNELAAEIVGHGFNNRPQRYDRILVKGLDSIHITGFNTFGRTKGPLLQQFTKFAKGSEKNQALGLSYGSDHWGVRCTLEFADDKVDQAPKDAGQSMVSLDPKEAPQSLAETSEPRECLSRLHVFPSKADIDEREAALILLKDIILDGDRAEKRGKPSFVIVPVGSYGLGVWTASSDVDCLCIGPVSSKIFFALASQRLRRAASRGVKLLRRVNAMSGTMLELEISDIKMDLQYCPSTFIAETWPYAMKLHPSDPIYSLSTQALAKLKPVRDLYYLRRTIPDHAAFRIAFQLVKYWAKQRGIYAAKWGYLGGIHISILLARVCKLLSQQGQSVSVPTILTTFFDHYSNFDWEKQLVFDPFFHKRLRYVRTTREPMAILGYHAPNLNTAHAASIPSVRTMKKEFKRANARLSEQGMTWATFLNNIQGSAEFLHSYKSYIRIDCQFWGVSLSKGSGFVGWLESRCVTLLVDLNRRLPNIHPRIWPARFVDEDTSEENTDYQGCYLLGLESSEGTSQSKDGMRVLSGALWQVLQKFETQIREDEKYFDSSSCWMSASVVKQAEVGSLRLDTRDWGDWTVGDDESEDEDEEEEEEETLTSDDEISRDADLRPKPKKNRGNVVDLPQRPAYEGKFRSSADVISRLRWDPNLDSGDYIVGYEDRFLGTKERPLDQWKAEQTDEEFIPQHRILYFKKRSDGCKVWDRKERRDEIFGSGVTSLKREGPEDK